MRYSDYNYIGLAVLRC